MASPEVVAPTVELVSGEVLRRQVFPPGEKVTATRGVGFLSAETGALETWSAVESSPRDYDAIQVTPDGALLVYYPDNEPTGAAVAPFIVERASGKTWRLGPGLWPVSEAAHGSTLVVAIREGDDEQAAVLNLATGTFSRFGERHHYLAGISGLAAPDGRRVAVHIGTSVLLLDLASAGTSAVAVGVAPDGFSLQPLPGALGFTIAPHDASLQRRWFSWEGRELDGHLGPGAVSPNGKYVAQEWSAGDIRAASGAGSLTVSAVTLVAREGGRPVAQFLGASSPRQGWESWSANGESLVVEVRDGYRLVGAAGQTLATIPDDIHVLEPRPSPWIAGLLGTNRGTIVNTVRGQTLAPNYEELPWRARWGTKPGELIVELATPGKGRDWPLDVLPFEARTGEIASPPKVMLAGGGCIDVRQRPASSAELVECAPPGVTGLLTAVDDPVSPPDPKASDAPPRKVIGVEDQTLTVWLHVSLSDGAEGWVVAGAVDWG